MERIWPLEEEYVLYLVANSSSRRVVIFLSVQQYFYVALCCLKKKASSTEYASSLSWQSLGSLVIDSWENLCDWQETATPSRGTVCMLTLKLMPASLSYFFFQNLLLVNFSCCSIWAIKYIIGLLSQKGENKILAEVPVSTSAPQKLNHSDMPESQVKFPGEESWKGFLLLLNSKKVQNILNLLHNCSSLISPIFPDMGCVLDIVGDQEKKDLKHPSNLHYFSKQEYKILNMRHTCFLHSLFSNIKALGKYTLDSSHADLSLSSF